MPEQITKYPDVTLQVLRGGAAKCGEGLEQKILTRCPPERFCSTPAGELCVYGIDDIPQMTQVTAAEIAKVVSPAAARVPASRMDGPDAVVAGVTFLAGLAIGAVAGHFRRR